LRTAEHIARIGRTEVSLVELRDAKILIETGVEPPIITLGGDSDEGDRWFRTDGDQRSGIDVISRRSEATLANGFCRK
jgi:hypothetical protein